MSKKKGQFHGKLSLRHRYPQRCKTCRKVRAKTIKIGKDYYCEECWRKEMKGCRTSKKMKEKNLRS